MPTNDLKAKLKNDFCNAVSHLLAPNNFKGTSLYSSINRLAYKWNASHIDIHEIIIEGVKRGIEHIEKTGEAIKIPEAWLRKVCTHILSDEVEKIIREEKKVKQQEYELSIVSYDAFSSEPDLMNRLERSDEALRSLPPSDQEIIRLRFFEGKTYEQIQHYYELQEEVITIPALRKRESRALKRLRAKFFAIYTRD
jgi:RNA polymerase sigma factor (sigma-70 family)